MKPKAPSRQNGQWSGDSSTLARSLEKHTGAEVRFDAGSRALYATDASNYRQVPIGVVLPSSADDVVQTIALCRRHHAPVLSRGGGTSLAGQCCNVAVAMDMSKRFNRVLEIDPDRRLARVEPGIVLDELQKETRKHGFVFGPDPSTHTHCTIGGMIGNNSCGVHSVMAQFLGAGSRMSDNVHEMEIITYRGLRMRVGPTSEPEVERIIESGGERGAIYARLKSLRDRYAPLIRKRYPPIPRRVSGYNLDELLPENGFNVARALVGTESTCVTILEATVRLVPEPAARTLVILGYPDVYHAGDHIGEIMSHEPIGLEGMDDELVEYMRKRGMHPRDIELFPEGKGWLIVEFGGDSQAEADEKGRRLMHALGRESHPPAMKCTEQPAEQERIWNVRESGLGATAFVPGMKDAWPGWEDSAVPPERVGEYLRKLRDLFVQYGYHASLYGHFGQGCIHCRIDFDLVSTAGLAKYRAFVHEAADLVVGLGGSLSGEHGDGQARAELLPKMFGPELIDAFREFKAIWDPDGMMNPGKGIDAGSVLSDLRLGPNYRPWEPETHFAFPDDQGSFARATLRCVGVGKCRRHEGGTMCPSYMVTREEEHTTRGRAHLLFEMLQGEVLREGWKSRSVKDALDLCLACKGCKGECPVNVDMATYKAEFLAHYYQRRLRPRAAYSMGLIYWWARLASKMPRMANFLTHAPGFATVGKWIAGVAQDRQMPPLARATFKTWFFKRPTPNPDGPRVLLWPDTFNNYFHPQIAQAAVEVLEDAGLQVVVPRVSLCCGRPLYDFGMLKTARTLLRQILDTLHAEIAAGTPLVGIEPSCLAVFRDELHGLFPHDLTAQRLRQQSYTLAEFLGAKLQNYRPPRLQRRAIVHGHCHQKAIMGMDAEVALLKAMELDVHFVDSGCCGMAGSFGFGADHYEISVRCGEHALLPALREAGQDTLIVADGFSCMEQIVQLTDRSSLHLAQLIRLALHAGASSASSGSLDPVVKAVEDIPPGAKLKQATR
jgi:FAD/FMN-containing dehydrogenase/Fe-S oxidoreductase